MAGGADGLVRRELPRRAAGSDRHLDQAASEMLRAEGRQDRQARQPLSARVQHDRQGRRPARSSRATTRSSRHACRMRSSSGTQDKKTPLDRLLPKLDQITFHAKLGTQGERVKRIEALAGEIARTIGADPAKARLAARLAKADLVTGMVGEFPELQGLMGRYYALAPGRRCRGRRCDPRSLQAARTIGFDSGLESRAGGGARRQARYARRLLGDRRKADGFEGSLCAATSGPGSDPHHSRAAAAP